MINQEPDCAACQMPQELRWPDNRTEEASQEVIKFITLDNSLPSYSRRGLSDLAFLIHWGDVYETDLDLLDIGIKTTDSVMFEMQKEKQQSPSKTKIRSPFDGV